MSWTADTISDRTFRDKFVFVPEKLGEWLGSLDGKDIFDFGCGDATTVLSLALRFPASRVIGVEIGRNIEQCLPQARRQLGLVALPSNMALHIVRPGELHDAQARFDVIYNWSVMEHVDQALLPSVLAKLRAALKPGGKLFIQIQPLYYSSNGSHLMSKFRKGGGTFWSRTAVTPKSCAPLAATRPNLPR